MMPSIAAVQSLYQRGFITKKAAVRILARREDIIKKAFDMPWIGAMFGKKPSMFSRATHSNAAEILGNIAKTVGVGTGLAAGAAGVHAGIRAIGDVGLRKRIEHSRKEVIQNLSSSGATADTDTQKAHYDRAFGVLAEYAPSLAENPVVATSIVKHIMGSATVGKAPIFSPELIKNMVDIEANVERGRTGRGLSRGFAESHAKPGALQLGSTLAGAGRGAGH